MDHERFDREAQERSIALTQNIMLEWWQGGVTVQCVIIEALFVDACKVCDWWFKVYGLQR